MKTLNEIEPNDCRYPSGEHEITFCAAQKHLYQFKGQLRRSSYCREHHFVCTTITYDHRLVPA